MSCVTIYREPETEIRKADLKLSHSPPGRSHVLALLILFISQLCLSAQLHAAVACVSIDGGDPVCTEVPSPNPIIIPGGGGSGSGGGFDGGGDFGGGGPVNLPVAANISIQPPEPHRATCQDSQGARLSHANRAFGLEQSRRLATPGLSPIRTGAIVVIQFFGGGTELYQVSAAFSTSPFTGPIPSTLSCE